MQLARFLLERFFFGTFILFIGLIAMGVVFGCVYLLTNHPYFGWPVVFVLSAVTVGMMFDDIQTP